MKTLHVMMEMMVNIEHDDDVKEKDLMHFVRDIASDLRVHQSRYGMAGTMKARSEPATFDIKGE